VKPIVAIAAATLLCAALARPAAAVERIHYIAADEVLWNYAPQHKDLIAGAPLPPLHYRLGWVFHKAMYREYTDGTFTKLLPRPPQDAYLGIVGPVIHAQVGDTVVVVFRNHTRFPLDIAPSGLVSNPAPKAVAPGGTQTYQWPIRENEGPGRNDESSILYVYQSDVSQSAAENSGLIGPIIVTRWGSARPDGSPNDVDQEIVALYSDQAETRSLYFAMNVADKRTNPRHVAPLKTVPFFIANVLSSINGYSYGNMPIPKLREGAHVRWYLLSTQNDVDGHFPTFDGQTVVWQGNRLDSVPLISPHVVVDMWPDNPGIWLLVCTLNVHIGNGMEARYEVVSSK
jgi:FtsP/CotA-like multicopper oxidase with cupredoxin domain